MLTIAIARSTTTRDQHRKFIARGKPPCGICGDDIDYTLRTPHPDSYEVDHIEPLDAGGEDVLDNKQASHRRCNRAKWNLTAEQRGPRVFITERTW